MLHRPPSATSHRPSRLSGPRAACSGRRGRRRRHGGPHQLQVRLCDAVVPAQVDLEVVPGGVHLGAQPAGRVAGVQRLVVGQGGGAREALAADGAEDASATGTACRHTACAHGVSTHRRTGVSNNHRPTVGSSSAPTDHRSGASDRTRQRARLERERKELARELVAAGDDTEMLIASSSGISKAYQRRHRALKHMGCSRRRGQCRDIRYAWRLGFREISGRGI